MRVGLFEYVALVVAVGLCARFDDHPVVVLSLLAAVCAALILRSDRARAPARAKRREEREI